MSRMELQICDLHEVIGELTMRVRSLEAEVEDAHREHRDAEKRHAAEIENVRERCEYQAKIRADREKRLRQIWSAVYVQRAGNRLSKTLRDLILERADTREKASLPQPAAGQNLSEGPAVVTH